MTLEEEIKEVAKQGDYKKLEIHIYKESSGIKRFMTYAVGAAVGFALSAYIFFQNAIPVLEKKIEDKISQIEETSEDAFKKNLQKCVPELIDDAAKYIKEKYYDKSTDAIDEILEKVVKKIPKVIEDYVDDKIEDLTDIDAWKKKLSNYLKNFIDDLLDSEEKKREK